MKTALVTGATDGIGKASAKKLLSESWKVVIVGRNPAMCERTVTELQAVTRNNEISAIVADLSFLIEAGKATDIILQGNKSFYFLFLNANAIANARTIS